MIKAAHVLCQAASQVTGVATHHQQHCERCSLLRRSLGAKEIQRSAPSSWHIKIPGGSSHQDVPSIQEAVTFSSSKGRKGSLQHHATYTIVCENASQLAFFKRFVLLIWYMRI